MTGEEKSGYASALFYAGKPHSVLRDFPPIYGGVLYLVRYSQMCVQGESGTPKQGFG